MSFIHFRKRLGVVVGACALMTMVVPGASAQEIDSLEAALMRATQNTVDDNKANATRSLNLQSGQSEASAGLYFLSSSTGPLTGTLGSATALPLGYSFGLGDAIEAGAGFDLTFNPLHAATLVSNLSVYGQYVFIPDMIAGQLSVTVAGGIAAAHSLNLQVDVPILLRLMDEKLLLYLQPRGFVNVGVSNLATTVGGFSQGALALYKITPHIFANVESTLYFAFGSGAVSTPFGGTGGFSGRSPIPLAFGGGYMFTEQTAFRLNLQLTTITRSPAVGLTLSAVQFF